MGLIGISRDLLSCLLKSSVTLKALQNIVTTGTDVISTLKYKEWLVILQSIGIIVIKSKETRVITYSCRYSSGH